MHYGEIKRIEQNPEAYPTSLKEVMYSSCDSLKEVFRRNAELCKICNISLMYQMREIKSIYGMTLTKSLLSELKNGKRYKASTLFLGVLKHYWNIRGYEFVISL